MNSRSSSCSIFLVGLQYGIDNYLKLHEKVFTKHFDCEATSVPIESIVQSFNRRSFTDIPLTLFRLSKWIQTAKPSYVVTCGPKTGFLFSVLSLFLNFNHIHWFTGQQWAISRCKYLSPSLYVDLFIRYVSHCCSDSLAQVHFMDKTYLFSLGRPIHTPANGGITYVEPTLFDLGQQRLANHHHKRQLTIGFLGRLCLDKGLDLFFDIAQTFSSDPTLRFLACGPLDHAIGTSSKVCPVPLMDLVENINLLPNSQCRTGFVAKDDFFQQVDILLAPSRREGFCNTIIEANACGIPVVCSSIYGFDQSVVVSINGFKCRTLLDYCSAINSLRDPVLYRLVSTTSFEFSQQYSYPSMFSSLVSLYSSLLQL